MLNKTRNTLATKHTFNLIGLKVDSIQSKDIFITAESPKELYMKLVFRLHLQFKIVARDSLVETQQQTAQKNDLSQLTKPYVAVFRYFDEHTILFPVDDFTLDYELLMKFMLSVSKYVAVMSPETMILTLQGLNPDDPRYKDIANVLMEEYATELVKYSQAL